MTIPSLPPVDKGHLPTAARLRRVIPHAQGRDTFAILPLRHFPRFAQAASDTQKTMIATFQGELQAAEEKSKESLSEAEAKLKALAGDRDALAEQLRDAEAALAKESALAKEHATTAARLMAALRVVSQGGGAAEARRAITEHSSTQTEPMPRRAAEASAACLTPRAAERAPRLELGHTRAQGDVLARCSSFAAARETERARFVLPTEAVVEAIGATTSNGGTAANRVCCR
ncbi:hypothetical protein AB1Y20_011776 [Prymnesium parvum]